jgi:hypothetical protein
VTGQLVEDLDETAYHAHPALSSTGARLLLEAPARFDHNRRHPRPDTKSFDVGTAAHSKVLGVGSEVVAYPDDVLAVNGAASTAAAKAFAADARALGQTPVKAADARAVDAMAEAVLRHPVARQLLEAEGASEVSAFAIDPITGVEVRARIDRLTADRSAMIDLKTTDDASRDGFAKTVAKYRYDVQDAWYEDVLAIIEGSAPRMQFVVVEKSAPYLVAVHSLSDEFAEIGRHGAAKARAIYAACLEHDAWPGYPAEQAELMPPFWLTAQYMESRVA